MLTALLVVYWLMFFSVVVHGLSVPLLNGLFKILKVPVVRDHPMEIMLLSENEPVPNNSVVDRRGHSVLVNNRFSCISDQDVQSDADEQPQEAEPDSVTLRSSGQNESAESLERASTKESDQIERMTIREVV